MTKPKKKQGKPTVMTPETIAKLDEAFAWGCSDREACMWADIATATLYQYQVKNPSYTERKAALKSKPILKARKSVIKGFDNDPNLALKFLERKKKDEFSLRTETDVTSSGQPIQLLGLNHSDLIPQDKPDGVPDNDSAKKDTKTPQAS